MELWLVLLICAGGMLLILGLAWFLGISRQSSDISAQIRRLGGSKDNAERLTEKAEKKSLFGAASDASREGEIPSGEQQKLGSQLTLQRRLKFAQMPIPVGAFHALEISISIVVCVLVNMKMNIVMTGLALLAGPIFMRWLVAKRMAKRFMHFDSDFPQFLMSLVGLLKTGMTAFGAVEAAAQGLDSDSLVRNEVELMIERLRVGVSEDKSIGAFGEDIYHPEIELFVQALLLSRRVGGTLSQTLERLAKQVRKRQFFRNSANSAVGMQRGSIWIIIGMLCAIEGYLYAKYPDMINESIQSEMGWQIWQTAFLLIIAGIFWVRQVTKIRV